MQFVPPGQPGAGSLKLASYRGGGWYDADVVADGAGTYDLANVREIVDSRIDGGPEGFVYVPTGSPQFSGPSLLVSEYGVDEVAAYQVDANGDPVIATRRVDDHRPRRRRGRAARPGDRRLPVLHLRRRQPRRRRARLRARRRRSSRRPWPERPSTPSSCGARCASSCAAARSSSSSRRGSRSRSARPSTRLKGRVTIVAAGDQQADFYDGVFQLGQTSAAKPLTTAQARREAALPARRQGERGRQAQEEAAAVGGWQRQVQDRGQAQRGDRGRHQVAGRGPLQSRRSRAWRPASSRCATSASARPCGCGRARSTWPELGVSSVDTLAGAPRGSLDLRLRNGIRVGILGLIVAAAIRPGVAVAAEFKVDTTADGDDKECVTRLHAARGGRARRVGGPDPPAQRHLRARHAASSPSTTTRSSARTLGRPSSTATTSRACCG